MAQTEWWWADYVDKYLTSQLAECWQWLKESPDAPFSAAITVTMSDSDGIWAAWLNFSPVELTHGTQIRILVDHDSNNTFAPLVMRRTLVRDPYEDEWLISRIGDPSGMVLRRYRGLSEWIIQPKPLFMAKEAPPTDYIRAFSAELCRRHQGCNLAAEADGIMSFVVKFA